MLCVRFCVIIDNFVDIAFKIKILWYFGLNGPMFISKRITNNYKYAFLEVSNQYLKWWWNFQRCRVCYTRFQQSSRYFYCSLFKFPIWIYIRYVVTQMLVYIDYYLLNNLISKFRIFILLSLIHLDKKLELEVKYLIWSKLIM